MVQQEISFDKHTDYKTRRTTLALVIASAYMLSQAKTALRKALEVVEENNFDFERTDQSTLEVIYANVDNELLAKVKSEYSFFPRMGSIMHDPTHSSHCALCGKGDSKDDGTNEDKLVYTFKLENTAGGKDLWVGSTCIMNYGLKVDGAGTEAEAKAMLAKTLRDHIAEWKKEAWRQTYPQHAQIPQHYAQLCELTKWLHREAWRTKIRFVVTVLNDNEALDYRALYDVMRTKGNRLYAMTKTMGTVARFYARSGYLTDDKQKKWDAAQETLAEWEWMRKLASDVTTFGDDEVAARKYISQAKLRRFAA